MFRIQLPRLVMVAALLLGVNFVFVGVQHFEKRGDRVKLSSLEIELGVKRSAMREMESWLEEMTLELSSSSFEIRTLKSRIEALDQKYPAGIPTNFRTEYDQAVEQHNLLAAQHNAAVSKYDALYISYSEIIDQHNVLTNQAENLEKRLGRTVYFLPVERFTLNWSHHAHE